MSEEIRSDVGALGWIDLTVPDAQAVRDFYQEVVGWETGGLDMGGYEDYFMKEPGSGRNVAGVCHARGVNAGLPPVWMVYVAVADLERSLERCRSLGGRVLADPKPFGDMARYAVIADPAGAVMAIYVAARG